MPKLESLSLVEQVGVKMVEKEDPDTNEKTTEEQPALLETVSGLDMLPQLRRLNLSTNKLPDLSSLPELPNLRELTLDGNPISKLEDLHQLRKYGKLTELNMAGCPIAEESRT